MQSAGLRRRVNNKSYIELSHVDEQATRGARQRNNGDPGPTGLEPLDREHTGPERAGFEPPRFIVDLSSPPGQRYNHIAPHFRQQLSNTDFKGLFDDVVRSAAPPALAKCIHGLARLALRRVYTAEETAELRGISKAAAIPLHLLVAFNVLLDLLLGCTSGGCRVEETKTGGKASQPTASRMLHFRTLDWGMDALRQIVVEIDFVARAGGPVVASSLTYFGYVGVLTGVRAGLSLSLNFRPRHDTSTLRRRAGFRAQQLLVLLGLRQSISSVLRGYLLRPDDDDENDDRRRPLKTAEDLQVAEGGPRMSRILRHLASSPSTAAYLVFCTPQKVYVVEKDHRATSVRSANDFLAACNHDVKDEESPSEGGRAAADLAGGPAAASGMEDLVRYSTERKTRLDAMWRRAARKYRRGSGTRSVAVDDVLRLVGDGEISNEETHYAVLMDPQEGKIVWRRAYLGDDFEVE